MIFVQRLFSVEIPKFPVHYLQLKGYIRVHDRRIQNPVKHLGTFKLKLLTDEIYDENSKIELSMKTVNG